VARETQEQRLAKYRDRITASRRWRENQGYVETWRRMIDLYRGRQGTEDSEVDEAVVNLCFSVMNVVVAAVTTQYPKFTVAPNQLGQDDQAVIAEAVLNYAWRHYNFHDEFQQAVIDMCMVGHGWLKVGWRYEEKEQSKTLTASEQFGQVAEQTLQAEQQAAALPPEAAPAAGALPTNEDIAAGVEPTQNVVDVIKDDPFVERVSPFDIVVDTEACAMRELRWIAQRSVRDLSEVRDDPAYNTTARHKVEADLSVGGSHNDDYRTSDDHGGLSEQADDDDRVTIWELYDLVAKEWCVFAEAGEGFLVKPGKIPTPFDNPFVMYRDHDVPETFYPIGEIESVETLQEELNKTRTQQIEARKQFIRKFIAREVTMNPRAREALMSEIDGDVAVMTDDDRPLSDMIIAAPSLSFDPQVFIAHSNQIVTDLQMVSGLSDYQFGQMPDTRRLATEAMAVEGATNARASFKLSKVERTLALTGRHLLQTMQSFMESERVARISGPGGEMLFTFTPDDIEGEFDLLVEAGSTQPKNDMIRRQEAVTLFNTLAPFMGTLIDPQALITYLLSQGYDIKNVDRFFAPPPPPMMGMPGEGQPGAPGQEMAPGGAGPGGAMPPGPAPDMGMGMPEGNGAPPAAMPPIPAGV
jgi:hypothetical protein